METKVTDDEATALFASYINQVIEKANRAQALEEAVKALKETIDFQNEKLKEVRQSLFDSDSARNNLSVHLQERTNDTKKLRDEFTSELGRLDEDIEERDATISAANLRVEELNTENLRLHNLLDERDVTISDLRDEIELHDDEIERKDDWAQVQKSLEARVKWLEENTKKYP